MREVKFRVWDGFRYIYFDNHRYDLIYNDISGWNVCPNVPNYKGEWTTGESSDTAESFKLEQYTGLKDRNGKEVYEGDILKHVRKYNSGHISECQVVFRKGGFSLDYGNLIYESIDIIDRTDYQFEIIGNINESHELLNQLKEETK